MNPIMTREQFSARIKAGEEISIAELECADLTQEERAELLRESILEDIASNGGKSRFIDLGDGRFALRLGMDTFPTEWMRSVRRERASSDSAMIPTLAVSSATVWSPTWLSPGCIGG